MRSPDVTSNVAARSRSTRRHGARRLEAPARPISVRLPARGVRGPHELPPPLRRGVLHLRRSKPARPEPLRDRGRPRVRRARARRQARRTNLRRVLPPRPPRVPRHRRADRRRASQRPARDDYRPRARAVRARPVRDIVLAALRPPRADRRRRRRRAPARVLHRGRPVPAHGAIARVRDGRPRHARGRDLWAGRERVRGSDFRVARAVRPRRDPGAVRRVVGG